MLRVWLPLTKDLRQQGLSNVTVTNNGATYSSTGGKLGGCYIFDGVDDAITVGNLSTLVTDNFSFTCWFYHDDTWSSKNYETIFGGPSGFELETKNGSTQSPVIRAYSWGGSTFTYELNKWNHLVMTRTTSETKFYLNGELKLTGTAGTIPSGNYFIGSWSSTTGQNFKGKVNDVRIYDHCLSPMEVKELAKGLVLHYPLNRQGWGQENLLPCGGTYTKNSPWATTLNRTDGYAWVTGSAFEATPGKTYTISVECDGTLSSAHGSGGLSVSDKPWAFWLYICNTNTSVSWQTGSYDTPVCLTNNNYNYRKIGNTHVWTYTLSSSQKYISLRTNSYSDGSTNLTIKWWNMKIEEGDKFTGWSPNSSSALATTMGLNSTTEYDCSGFCNNGEKIGALTYTSDTPKYSVATYCPAGTGIFGHPNITFSQFTIAFWGKHSATDKMLMGSNASISSTNTNWYWYGDNSFKYPSGEFYYSHNAGSAASLLNKWTHFVATYDGANVTVYRNGIYEGVKALTGTQTLEHVSIGNGYSGSSYWENGCVSDLRIYATALSADDVKSLYQNSAYIDSSGNVYGAVHSEV